ncbi:hypothetical protein SNOG_02381 [Parastagonospora nodorum SN15]|uniref:Uncharacterized protein n=1 Tax=Phaeosphaeria nodorum (strain SN15 / ATCC MYA-4574 / FGSC 10173) TaxID=321614 RepID=Q0V0T3_PHANO|nr:hypothetical protein SNOG_02381 [Parastagonospora nodorum SN15]EAT90593.1 hypothetical protein SNOG_02381 [Parastagonospora nodorum SN15]
MAMTICLEDRCLANVGHSVAIVAFGCFRGGTDSIDPAYLTELEKLKPLISTPDTKA